MDFSRILIALTLAVFVCNGGYNPLFAQEEQPVYNPLGGQKLFHSKGCIRCHAVYGFGGKIGSDLGRALAKKGAVDIVAAMWNHSNEMVQASERGRSIPQLEPTEMAAILSFIYYLDYFGTPGSVDNGARIYQTKGCVNCHSPAKSKKISAPDLLAKPFASPLQLGQAMWNHSGRMLANIRSQGTQIPTFSGGEMMDLFAFLREGNSTRNLEALAAVPGDYHKGKRLIKEKQCLRCHSVSGRGGTLAPDFSQINFHRSAVEIMSMMWNHTPGMWRKMEKNSIPLPNLAGTDLADIMAYLYFLGFRTPTGDPKEGEILFQEKQCNKCHSLQLTERRIGPNLATVRGLDEMINISSAMWNHNINMLEQMKLQNIPFPRFNGEELKDLLTFILSVREKELEEE